MTSRRKCGPCIACCSCLDIDELDKPAGVLCPHCVRSLDGSCTVYRERPHACRSFECYWLSNRQFGKFTDRPDMLGVMFRVVRDPRVPKDKPGDYPAMGVHVIRDGALESTRVKELIAFVSTRMPVWIFESSGDQQ